MFWYCCNRCYYWLFYNFYIIELQCFFLYYLHFTLSVRAPGVKKNHCCFQLSYLHCCTWFTDNCYTSYKAIEEGVGVYVESTHNLAPIITNLNSFHLFTSYYTCNQPTSLQHLSANTRSTKGNAQIPKPRIKEKLHLQGYLCKPLLKYYPL